MLFLKIGAAVLFSHFVEGISGFGCMILALPVVSALLGMKAAVPMLVILSTLFDLMLVWKDRHQILWREVLKMTILTSITMPVGLLALQYLPEKILEFCLGAFMIVVAIYGIATSRKDESRQNKEPNSYDKLKVLFLPLAGLIQGAFGGSGPFMILYAKSVLKDKTVFRGTMAMIWVCLNTINLIQYQVGGLIDANVLKNAAAMIPFLALGYVAGTWAHKKMDSHLFNLLIYAVVFIAGITMIRNSQLI